MVENLHISITKTNLWYLVDGFLNSNLGRLCERYKNSNEPIYLICRNGDLVYKDSQNPNRLWIKSSSGYIRTLQREKSFGIINVCHYGKWYTVTNCGYQDKKRQRWWNIEIKEFGEDEMKKVIPEIINCSKTKDGNAEAWFS